MSANYVPTLIATIEILDLDLHDERGLILETPWDSSPAEDQAGVAYVLDQKALTIPPQDLGIELPDGDFFLVFTPSAQRHIERRFQQHPGLSLQMHAFQIAIAQVWEKVQLRQEQEWEAIENPLPLLLTPEEIFSCYHYGRLSSQAIQEEMRSKTEFLWGRNRAYLTATYGSEEKARWRCVRNVEMLLVAYVAMTASNAMTAFDFLRKIKGLADQKSNL